MRKSRTIFALVLLCAVLFSQCLTAYAANDKTANLGAIWTTNAAGTQNNENHYATIADVFLNGGPGGSVFTDDYPYYVMVTTTNGTLIGHAFTVTPVNGSFRVCLSAIGANPGPGVYKVHVGIDAQFSTAKTDNFSLVGGSNVDTALLTIAKRITGQGFDRNAPFGVTITPPAAGMQPIIGTITANQAYSVSLPYGT